MMSNLDDVAQLRYFLLVAQCGLRCVRMTGRVHLWVRLAPTWWCSVLVATAHLPRFAHHTLGVMTATASCGFGCDAFCLTNLVCGSFLWVKHVLVRW